MQIFKFGGASIKNAAGVKNFVALIKTVKYKETLIVVSAMGKTTNALEQVVNCYFTEKTQLNSALQDVINYHNAILLQIFDNESYPIFKKVALLFKELSTLLRVNKSPNYSFVYDQVVSYGELVSTTILSYYLKHLGINNTWIDARQHIKTNNNYQDANVDWKSTQYNIKTNVDKNTLSITQGFLGSDTNNFTTTLGREGSDYTAAIFAYCLNAHSVCIYKDVPGILNADPRYFNNAQLISQMSYQEAIELAFYGASIIHPKTIQPLKRKEIPLYVKSFLNPTEIGTKIESGTTLTPKIPCFIVKKQQILVAVSSLDFSYIVEEHISDIFLLLHTYKMKVSVIQNSAISFSVCIEDMFKNIDALLLDLKSKFSVTYYKNVSLYTVRHYNATVLEQLEKGKTIVLKQLTPQTVHLVTK